MSKKYIKGKDGKFKGSIGDPTLVPQATQNTSLPSIPSETSSMPPAENSDNVMRLYQKAQMFQTQSSQNLAPTIKMSATNIETGEIEELEVIESVLTNESREPGNDRLVRLSKDEVKFMDRDKITNALGYSIMGQGFSMFKNLVLYKQYAEDKDYIIYKVDVK